MYYKSFCRCKIYFMSYVKLDLYQQISDAEYFNKIKPNVE